MTGLILIAFVLLDYIVWRLYQYLRTKHAILIEKQGRELIKHLLDQVPRPKTKGWARYASIYFCLFGSFAIAAFTWSTRPQIVTEHHVAIVDRTYEGDFIYYSDEEPKGGSFRTCLVDKKGGVDTDALLTQGIGYIADYAIWEENGTCKSILQPDLGFWFKDKANNFTYRRIK